MFASNMKILTLNTNNTSPTVQAGSGGSQTTVKELNNNAGNERMGGGGSNVVVGGSSNSSSHKLNKREQKHNGKTKFMHGSSNKMQQHMSQQQQQQKYHHNNNGNNNGGGNKMKKQHYNNSSNNSSNTTSSLNRKKYYQQQQQQQQHHHHQQHYQQQQQQYLSAMQHNINSTPTTTTTITNNNNSNLVKNQNFTNINILVQQQQSLQHHNTVHTTSNFLNHHTNTMEPICTCLPQQSNSDKLSLSSCSSSSSSSLTVSSTLPQVTGDYHHLQHHQPIQTICYDNNLKSSSCVGCNLSSNSKPSIAHTQHTTSSQTSCVNCWTSYTKLPQQQQQPQPTSTSTFKSTSSSSNLQQFVAIAVAAAVASKCNSNTNLAQASSSTSTSSSSTTTTTLNTTTSTSLSSSATKKKSYWKNSNTCGGGSCTASSSGNCGLSSSGYSTSSSSTQSPKLSKEKLNVSDKNQITNTGGSSRQSLGKISNNSSNSANVQKCSTTVVSSINSSQQKQISKHSAEKAAMNTSLTGSSGSSFSKTSAGNGSNISISKEKALKQQQDTLEKDKLILKSANNNSNNNSETIKINGNSSLGTGSSHCTAISSPSTPSSSTTASAPSSPNSYTLDFLHSVGVKMTGVSLRSSNGQGLTNTYGNQTSSNTSGHNNYPYTGMTTNQRQPRYMYGGTNSNSGGNGTGNQQQHYHHHQPSQLTIASFLQKDLLGGENTASSSHTNSNNVGSSSSNSRNSNNYNDQQQQHYTQQPITHSRYHHNYYGTPYQQHSAGIHNTNYGVGGGYGGCELARIVTNGNVSGQRNSCYAYANYHNTSGEGVGMAKSNSLLQQQSRQSQNNLGNYTNASSTSQTNKKSSYASSTASTCSSSSSKSISSNSSNTSSHKLQTSTAQESNNGSSNLNLAIETLPSKSLGSVNQRGNHRGHHHNHHGHLHHNHHSHHHNQHSMMNSPNILQHQNYYNLTYVSTDGSVSGAPSRGCSPAPQSLPPTPLSATNCHSPKPMDSSPGPVAMLMNFNSSHLQYPRYSSSQQHVAVQPQQQFHQLQQHNFLNKKMLAPLTLTMSSPSPSPTPPNNSCGASLNTQQAPPPPHNIICCSQLDEATTAAAAAAAATCSSTSGIIAGNDYDSDSSSNHSSAQHKYDSLKTTKSSLSSSSSSSSVSNSSLSLIGQQGQQNNCSQPTTPATCGPTTPLHSPLGYNYGSATTQAFPNLQLAQHLVQQQHPYKTSYENPQQPQMYGNSSSGVISLLNLPTKSPSSCYTEDDYQQQAQHQFYFNANVGQTSADHLNITSALTAVASRSNNSSGYWSTSPHNNHFIYKQTPSTQMTLMPPTNSSSSSCGSSSASISPRLPNDDMQTQKQLQHNCCLTSASSSPSPCTSCLNEKFNNIMIGNNSNPDSGTLMACSNTSSVSGCSSNCSVASLDSTNGGHHFKRGSSQLLAQQQQRLIAQQTYQSSSSSTSSLSSSSASTLTSAARSRGGIGGGGGTNANNGRSNQLPLTQNNVSVGSSNVNVDSGSQQVPPLPPTQYLYSHHQQPLPPPMPPHSLLYNNPQTTHHMRALNTISSSVHDFFTHTPPDRFLARAHLVEAKEAPVTLLNNSKWDHLSQGIWKKFINSQQTEETFKQKMRLWRYLYLFIKNAYPRYGLYLVGSTISGFGSDSSDVDMCLVSRSASSIDPRMEALFNLTVLRDCLSKSGEFENFNLIEAKVPILRFRDHKHQLEVDLNFNNCVGIKNTHLLYCYSQLDWRLRPLVLVTKLWAQYHNINNAKNMTISSYSLVLMVIHFLQYAVNPPVLPCLHDIFPHKFPLLRSNDIGYVDMNETIGPYDSKNNQTIAELFLNFLEYFSCFDYTQYAISVRTGGVLPINVCRVAKSIKNDIHQWKELCIEEPFDLTNTARSVYDYETFERVKAVFVASWRVLQETLDLNSVFSPIIIPSPCSTNVSTRSSPKIAFNEIESNDSINDTKNNLEQYVHASNVKDAAVENFEENNSSFEEEGLEEAIIDIDGDGTDDGAEDSILAASKCGSNSTVSGIRKLVKHKDLNRTLTPRQIKVYSNGGADTTKSTSMTSSSPSLTCIKNSTKNVRNNNSNTNTKRATPMLS